MKNWLAILTIATLAGLVVVPWAHAVHKSAWVECTLYPFEGDLPDGDLDEPWDRRFTLEQHTWDGGELIECNPGALVIDCPDQDVGIPGCPAQPIEITWDRDDIVRLPPAPNGLTLELDEWESPTP